MEHSLERSVSARRSDSAAEVSALCSCSTCGLSSNMTALITSNCGLNQAEDGETTSERQAAFLLETRRLSSLNTLSFLGRSVDSPRPQKAKTPRTSAEARVMLVHSHSAVDLSSHTVSRHSPCCKCGLDSKHDGREHLGMWFESGAGPPLEIDAERQQEGSDGHPGQHQGAGIPHKTWTVPQRDGPNHLGSRCKALPAHRMTRITSGCVSL